MLGFWGIEFNIPEGEEHDRRWLSMSSISQKGERGREAGFRGIRSVQVFFGAHIQLAIFGCCDVEPVRFSGHGCSASGAWSPVSQMANGKCRMSSISQKADVPEGEGCGSKSQREHCVSSGSQKVAVA